MQNQSDILGHVHTPAWAGIPMHACVCVCARVGDVCTWYVCVLSSLADPKGKIQGKRRQLMNHREKEGWAKAKIMKKKEGKLEYRIKGGNEKLTVHIAGG